MGRKKKEPLRCICCDTILSRFNPYKLCNIHQEKVLRERLPSALKKELPELMRKRDAKRGPDYDHTQEEREVAIQALSQFLETYSDQEIIKLVEEPEEVYESLAKGDKTKAENFAEVVIFLRGKKEKILEPFLRDKKTGLL